MNGERKVTLARGDHSGRGRPGLRAAQVAVCLSFCVAVLLLDRSRLDSMEREGL